MKKALVFFGIALILSASMFLLAQASEQAWRDFRVFIGIIEDADSQVQQLYNQLMNVESEKAEIIDDAERLAELTKIIDVHPDYTVANISAKLDKLKILRQYLENNGYIQ